MKLTLIQKREETKDVETFIFESSESLTWRAGQYLHYTLPHENPDDRGVERYFTIASAPYERHIQITTRFSEKSSTFKTALNNLPIGATIDADDLEGDFVVEDTNQEFVFIAGGIGITPYRAILLALQKRNQPMDILLLYASRNKSIVFREELDAISRAHKTFRIHYIIEPERIDQNTILSSVYDVRKPLFYVSGPEPMVQSFETMLAGMGIPDDHIKRDFFPGYTKI